MKSFYIYILLFLFASCVTKTNSIESSFVIITDDFTIPNSIEESPVYDYLLPRELSCENTMNLNIKPKIVRINESIDELDFSTEKNFFQKMYNAKVTPESAKAKLSKVIIPKEWKKVDYKPSEKKILNYLNNLASENYIIISDRNYKFIDSTKIILFKNNLDLNEKISQILCKDDNKTAKFALLSNLKSGRAKAIGVGITDTIQPPQPPLTNPCNLKSIPEASDLVFDIKEVLDTSLDYDTRRENAKNIFKKYFDEQAYVALYNDPTSKNPKIWDAGEGILYFVDRLAALESVNNISVFRAEFSKETGKISGVYIVECHNASELVQ